MVMLFRPAVNKAIANMIKPLTMHEFLIDVVAVAAATANL